MNYSVTVCQVLTRIVLVEAENEDEARQHAIDSVPDLGVTEIVDEYDVHVVNVLNYGTQTIESSVQRPPEGECDVSSRNAL